MGSGDRIYFQLFSWLYALALLGFFVFVIYSVNSIRKSQRSIAATLEKMLVYFQEKDAGETKK